VAIFGGEEVNKKNKLFFLGVFIDRQIKDIFQLFFRQFVTLVNLGNFRLFTRWKDFAMY
jgi:translation initiation factor 2 beta subunit (eIF-2beta)/eIF-5